jgi:hypothetical protein
MDIAMFKNPMIQAFRGAAKNLTDPDPAVSGATMAKLLIIGTIAGGAAGIKYLMMNDEEKDDERERTLYDRMSYYNVGGFRIRFPYGPEGVMVQLLYNSVMDHLLERTPVEAKKRAGHMVKRVFGIGSPTEWFGPQVNTIIENTANWSFFRQRHIVSPWLAGLPEEEQYYVGTPEFYKKIGEMSKMSPEKISYFVSNALGRQSDELIRLIDRIDKKLPIQEKADIPFIGRMFIRRPIGYFSASVNRVRDIEEKLRGVDSKLNSAGYGYLRGLERPNPGAPEEVKAVWVQLDALEELREGVQWMKKWRKMIKTASISGDAEMEENAKVAMTKFAQSLVMTNKEYIERFKLALELVQKLPERTKAEKAADFILR